MLGPVRFAHMETVVREAVGQWKEAEEQGKAKRRRVEEKDDLVRVLEERDRSVVVLRAMAAEKERAVKCRSVIGKAEEKVDEEKEGRDEKVPASSSSSLPAVVVDYSSMPLEKLRTLERARDATLSFLLKRIDTAEADLRAAESKEGT